MFDECDYAPLLHYHLLQRSWGSMLPEVSQLVSCMSMQRVSYDSRLTLG